MMILLLHLISGKIQKKIEIKKLKKIWWFFLLSERVDIQVKMAMVLMNQLNYDICDMINKVCIEDYKRQKIIDDYKKFSNGMRNIDDDIWNCFYNLEVEIVLKIGLKWSWCFRNGSDKNDMFKNFQNVKDYMNLNIDDNIVSVKLFIKRGFVDMAGNYCCVELDQDPKIIDYHNVPTYEDGNKYDDFDEDEFITHYNEMKELYDSDEMVFHDEDNQTIIFNKW